MGNGSKNHCDRLIPGGNDCANQINKGKCAFVNSEGECTGRTGAIGADLEKGKTLFLQRQGQMPTIQPSQ